MLGVNMSDLSGLSGLPSKSCCEQILIVGLGAMQSWQRVAD